MKRPYLLKKRGKYHYYRLPDEINFHSTGQTAKAKAEKWVLELIEKRKEGETTQRVVPTLLEFAEDFFEYETSRWIKRRIARGYEVTRPMANMRTGHLKNHILNAFGSRKVAEIRAIEIEDWLLVPSRTIEILEWWKSIAPFKEENDLVFAGRNGSQPINRDIVSKEFSKALERAKIKTDGRNLRTHSLRHTYNTIMKGVLTADMLREFTGHRSEQMTQSI